MEKIKIKNFMAIVRNNVGNDVWNSTMNSIWSSVGDRLRIIVRNSVISNNVRDRVRNDGVSSIGDIAEDSIKDNVKRIIDKKKWKKLK